MDHFREAAQIASTQRAQPLPHPPVCHQCQQAMTVTTRLLAGHGRPRLTYDATCPSCGAMLKGFA